MCIVKPREGTYVFESVLTLFLSFEREIQRQFLRAQSQKHTHAHRACAFTRTKQQIFRVFQNCKCKLNSVVELLKRNKFEIYQFQLWWNSCDEITFHLLLRKRLLKIFLPFSCVISILIFICWNMYVLCYLIILNWHSNWAVEMMDSIRKNEKYRFTSVEKTVIIQFKR